MLKDWALVSTFCHRGGRRWGLRLKRANPSLTIGCYGDGRRARIDKPAGAVSIGRQRLRVI